MDPSPKLVETLREYHSTKIHCDDLKTKQNNYMFLVMYVKPRFTGNRNKI